MIVRGRTHVGHMFPQAFQNFLAVVQNDHAVARIAARLVGRWQLSPGFGLRGEILQQDQLSFGS